MSASKAILQEIRPEGIEELVRFLAAFPGNDLDADEWREKLGHWWSRNPAFAEEDKRGWLIRGEDQAVVGCIARIPTRFKMGGDEIVVYSSSTWRVLPPYRSSSLRLILEQIGAARSSLLFVDSSTDAPLQEILKKLGFKFLPRGRRYGNKRKFGLFVLDYSKILERRMPGRAAKIAGSAANLLPWTIRTFSRSKKSLSVRLVREIDPSFDDLWERTRDQVENTNVRTSAVLGWLCFGRERGQKFLFACHENSENVGYIILQRQVNFGVPTLYVVDLWIDESRAGVTRALVRTLREYAARNGYAIIIAPYFGKKQHRRFRRAGFLPLAFRNRDDFVKYGKGLEERFHHDNSYFVADQGDARL